jgi:hypothetical protein
VLSAKRRPVYVRFVVPLILIAAIVIGGAVGVVLALGGESGLGDLRRQKAIWRSKDVHNYSFTFTSGDMCGTTRVRVEVQRDRVASSGIIPNACGGGVSNEPLPTVSGVFDRVQDAYKRADKVTVEYDPKYGFPASVRVDEDRSAVDDEHGFGIGEFRPSA